MTGSGRDAAGVGASNGFGHQARLADAGLAVDQDQAAVTVKQIGHERVESCYLCRPPDQDRARHSQPHGRQSRAERRKK